MKIFFILALLFKLTYCFANNSFKGRVVETFSNNKLVKRQYFLKNQNIYAIVTFDNNGSTRIRPVDSIFFKYNISDNLIGVIVYNYSKRGFTRTSNIGLEEYYKRIYYRFCIPILKDGEIFRDILNDFCIINNAVLSDGRSTQDSKQIYHKGKLNITEFSDLDSKFAGLAFDVQMYFYNRTLNSFRFITENNYLKSEDYYFENGVFKRSFHYRYGKITEIINLITTREIKTKEIQQFRYRQ
ncbi:hypothetical protein C8P68_105290 [Mucilaginibacter yixingensis]|uniref:Uncharacterized protein n=1 Tax=Mucilaginibacter yixingensis TaxID=1295612 RepID=A0A2T5J8K3_9SPHI|nr:hypothetical protein [Mucilaginibacter yixingensis]PTQ95780.1 hypothetical protein C8P68_105290 [Mucilaginibacter yixingensis]